METAESGRRSGMLLGEDFDVFGEQKQDDEEMSKVALQGTFSYSIGITDMFFKTCQQNNETKD